MPNLNAALGVAQLEQVPAFLHSKRQLAEQYASFFAADSATDVVFREILPRVAMQTIGCAALNWQIKPSVMCSWTLPTSKA